MIEDEFGEWMATIKVESFLGTNARGEAFSPAVDVTANWTHVNRSVINSEGKTVVSGTQVYSDDANRQALNVGARVTLPGDPYVYRVLQVQSWPGEDVHVEVALQ